MLDSSGRLAAVHLGTVENDESFGHAQRMAYAYGVLKGLGVTMNKLDFGGTTATEQPPAGDGRVNAIDKKQQNAVNPSTSDVVDARLRILHDGTDLEGQTVFVPKDTPRQIILAVQLSNTGTHATALQPSAHLYLSKQCTSQSWQPFGPSGEFYLGQGAIPIINAQEPFNLTTFACQTVKDITEPISDTLKIFYGADKPAEAAFVIVPKN